MRSDIIRSNTQEVESVLSESEQQQLPDLSQAHSF